LAQRAKKLVRDNSAEINNAKRDLFAKGDAKEAGAYKKEAGAYKKCIVKGTRVERGQRDTS
jgi:hypothetical protein